MSTQFRPIEIPPGVVVNPTKQMRSSNWAEVNLMRWREGKLAPVGGQMQYAYSFASRCRAIHGWYDLAQVFHIAYLCEQHLFVDTGGALTDITPLSGLSPVPYGAGAYGVGPYSGDPTYGIIPPNPYNASGGYSDGPYGAYAYGTARPQSGIITVDKIPDAWSLDNFGSVLYAMTSADGRLLMWDPAVGGRAVVQPPASGRGPVPNGRCFVVTPQRFIIIFGSYNDGTTGGGGSFRRFAWCDQENPGAWDYSSVTSQAGFLDIEPASPIITAISTRTGVLFWSGKKAYVSTFLGLPYVYNYAELADNCTPWSPESVVTTSSLALWMSEQGAFSYDGTSIAPVACMVRSWVDDNIGPNPSDLINVREQACAAHVGDFSEFWWFFPQALQTSGTPYNTRAIIYNYKEGWWSQARMSRSAGVTDAYNVHTIMADGLVAFQHEALNAYAHADLPWAETFDLNILSGSRLITVKQMMPDVQGNVSSLRYSLFYRNSRSLGTPEVATAPIAVRNDGYVDFRTTGRDIRLRISIDPNEGGILPVTVGQHLIDAVARGDR